MLVPVTWQNAVGVTVTENSLVKTAPTAWGNAGASSVQSVSSGNVEIAMTVAKLGTAYAFGLGNDDSDYGVGDIKFALKMTEAGKIHIFRDGSDGQGGRPFGTVALGDVLKIKIDGTSISFYQNDRSLISPKNWVNPSVYYWPLIQH